MDYDLENDNKGSGKGPFYGAAGFIFVTIAIFTSFSLQEQGSLDHWQVATLLLGTGLIAVLIFLPHFLSGIAERFESSNRQEESALANKTFLELKEMRSELDELAVKIDKVPTLVDKIVSESINPGDEEPQNSILEKLQSLESKLSQKIEEGYAVPPLLPEPGQDNEATKKSIDQLTKEMSLIKNMLDSLSQYSQTKPLKEPTDIPDEATGSKIVKNKAEDNAIGQAKGDGIPLKPNGNKDKIGSDVEKDNSLPANDPSGSDQIDKTDQNNGEEDHEDDTSMLNKDEDDYEDESDISKSTPTQEASESDEVDDNPNEIAEELDLGLPAPEETLRKVDALLSGQQSSDDLQTEEKEDKNIDKNGTTTVVANVMIGIGNKPFLRGEGPGLSWDEGVSMNFVEIGKWAWSPPRKNASLIVQVYRNDQDPDKGGKVEVNPGQKLEITPDFS